ncbi:putative Ig domain-containing protein [Rhizobium sp. ERR 922]|uniref:putative Ig domain-containing protein n=1 Tax=unclassified Rhizobium TaxID=2613769 RepID=UPI0011A5604D|nr:MULTISPECIES: putative Ig domain-containing protein [unclassified Rhizobium]TWB50061.1 putative Ig domain-containing protein [Rhizobium sp. ERR 922]TWB92442.1 putative Ig domain-containing protein [Rhizobium sp. ERR 942]
MLKLIFAATILIASSASAGEIVWRSPTTGTLTASDPVPPLEPAQPAFGIRYEPISVSGGMSVLIKPVGDVSGYSFSVSQPLPPGLLFDSATGRIVGVAAVTGNHDITVRATKDGFYVDLVVSMAVS